MKNPIIIFGAGSLGRVALDIFNSNEITTYCFLDDNEDLKGKEVCGVSILGTTEDENFIKLIGETCDAFVASDNNKTRKRIADFILKKCKRQLANAIHASVIMPSDTALGYGNMIQAGVVFSTHVVIGNACLFHTGAKIDYDVKIGDFVQIGAGSIIASGVTIEEGAFIGTGVTIVSGVKIGKNARIGAGSVVISDVERDATFFGNPAQKIER